MKKLLLVFMCLLFWGAVFSVPVKAEEAAGEVEISELNQVMAAQTKLEAREKPDDDAATVIVYESGDPVLVTGETADGWYRVSYQGREGFVHKSGLTDIQIDAALLDEEMEAASEEGRMVVEQVERYRAEVRRSRIWGTIIVLLVVGIFAVGIISTVRAEKKENDEEVIDLDRED